MYGCVDVRSVLVVPDLRNRVWRVSAPAIAPRHSLRHVRQRGEALKVGSGVMRSIRGEGDRGDCEIEPWHGDAWECHSRVAVQSDCGATVPQSLARAYIIPFLPQFTCSCSSTPSHSHTSIAGRRQEQSILLPHPWLLQTCSSGSKHALLRPLLLSASTYAYTR